MWDSSAAILDACWDSGIDLSSLMHNYFSYVVVDWVVVFAPTGLLRRFAPSKDQEAPFLLTPRFLFLWGVVIQRRHKLDSERR
jgi:hypothetical protein